MNAVVLWIGAIAPIAVLFILMSVFGMKTEKAALVGLVLSVVSALVFGKDSIAGIAINLGKGAWNALPILIVIWTAILLYQILEVTGAFRSVKTLAEKNTQDELFLILLFCWLFASFMQGITGFGVPVAVCAPLLIAIGVKPRWAVVITLLGHAWANTFGTFAMAWDALVLQSGIGNTIPTMTAACIYLALIDLTGSFLICFIYGKGKAIRHMLPFLLFISVIHGGGQFLSGCVNTTVAAFIPTTVALAAAIVIMRLGFYTRPWSLDSDIMDRVKSAGADLGAATETVERKLPVRLAILPFVLLVVFSVLILMVRPIHDLLYRPVIALSFPAAVTGRGFANEATNAYGPLHLFTHAAFILLLTDAVTWFVLLKTKQASTADLKPIGKRTLAKIVPTSEGLLLLVIMAQVLKGAGLMTVIAEGVAMAAGSFYGAAAPFIGILGAFVTSSNTSSNILLGSFQMSMSEILGMDSWKLLAAQTAGGAIGTVVGPSTIYLGMTTAGCREEAGWALRKMFPAALLEAAVIGIVTLIVSIG